MKLTLGIKLMIISVFGFIMTTSLSGLIAKGIYLPFILLIANMSLLTIGLYVHIKALRRS